MKKLTQIIFSIAILLGCLLPVARAADAVPADLLFTDRTYLLISVPDVDELKARWNASLTGRLLADPELAEFRSQFEPKLKKLLEGVEDEIGMSPRELLTIPAGELAFAVLKPPRKPLAFVVLMRYNPGKSAMVDQIYTLIKTQSENAGARSENVEYAETSIDSFSYKEEPGPDDPPVEPDWAMFRKDDTLVIASSVAAIESVLDRWDGQHERTLSTDSIYQYTMERCGNGSNVPEFKWFMNPLDLTKAAVSQSGNFQASMLLGFLPTLGLDKFKGMGGTVDIANDDFDMVSKSLFYVDRSTPPKGLMNLFQFNNLDQAPPAWVPGNASSYGAVNWDIAKAYEGIEGLFNGFAGMVGVRQSLNEILDDAANDPNGPGIHFKDDVIDNLTGGFRMAGTPTEDGGADENYLFTIGIKDQATMQTLLEKAIEQSPVPAEQIEYKDSVFYSLSFGALTGTEAGVTLCATEDALVISTSETKLENYVDGVKPESAIGESDNYSRVAAHMPEKTSMFFYQNQSAQLKNGYKLLRLGAFDQTEAMNAIEEMVGDDLDFSTLPPFETIGKYLTPHASYSVPDENGAYFVDFSLPSN